MKGVSKEWKQKLKALKKRLPGLQFAWVGNGHLEVTRDGHEGKVIVGGTMKSPRSMLNDAKRIERAFAS